MDKKFSFPAGLVLLSLGIFFLFVNPEKMNLFFLLTPATGMILGGGILLREGIIEIGKEIRKS